MSKQSDAKIEQGYEAKPILPICSNCGHFKSDFNKPYAGSDYVREFNLRCGIGGFAVKKQGTCNKYIFNLACK